MIFICEVILCYILWTWIVKTVVNTIQVIYQFFSMDSWMSKPLWWLSISLLKNNLKTCIMVFVLTTIWDSPFQRLPMYQKHIIIPPPRSFFTSPLNTILIFESPSNFPYLFVSDWYTTHYQYLLETFWFFNHWVHNGPSSRVFSLTTL